MPSRARRHGGVVDPAGLVPQAELAGADVSGDALAGAADHGQLEIVDRPGAVQGQWVNSRRSIRSISSGPLPLRARGPRSRTSPCFPARARVDDPLGQLGQGRVVERLAAGCRDTSCTSGRRRASARPAAAVAAGSGRIVRRPSGPLLGPRSTVSPTSGTPVAEVGDRPCRRPRRSGGRVSRGRACRCVRPRRWPRPRRSRPPP